ncbi:MAG: amino acid permease [Gemmatimonadota bacterium]|nr:MAG: amino acid permease [Gemmatimonadota bacterium]
MIHATRTTRNARSTCSTARSSTRRTAKASSSSRRVDSRLSQGTRGSTPPTLKRELGLGGAIMMGLGSILGTGVFVSIGVAAGIAGPAVILAIALAAFVAMCNAFSSAQLAASHPVSGGTYEYGYKYLHPTLGFTAGWMFLCAKSASAATAALGFAGYLLHTMGWSTRGLVPIAMTTATVLTLIVLSGIRRSNATNFVVVSITLLALLAFVLGGLPALGQTGTGNLSPFFGPGPDAPDGALHALLYATSLMFVAYTGYGRIATLGEEVRRPRRTIPRAILVTLIVSAALYVAVGFVAIGAAGPSVLAAATHGDAAPLEVAARQFDLPGVHRVVAVGAMTAMLGVLLNLILGLSRVLLAMGRRRDMPAAVARLDATQTTPPAAVALVGMVVAGLAATGNVKTTWSFSAFTVLIYYAITNLAALRLAREHRLYPRALAWCGLIACLSLAFWVEWRIWAAGLGLIAVGFVWQATRKHPREAA